MFGDIEPIGVGVICRLPKKPILLSLCCARKTRMGVGGNVCRYPKGHNAVSVACVLLAARCGGVDVLWWYAR